MKGNPPDQMPTPISYSESIGNERIHREAAEDVVVEVEAPAAAEAQSAE